MKNKEFLAGKLTGEITGELEGKLEGMGLGGGRAMFLCAMFLIAIFLFAGASNAFAAEWYQKGKSYEKCMDDEKGFMICRDDFIVDKNFCYGKERVWIKYNRKKAWYDRGEEKTWFDRKVVAVRNLNYKCEYHGWTKVRLVNDKWAWQCYLNNRAAKDEDCKGFLKR